MRKPLIGVVPLVDRERESYWMIPGYLEGVRQAGGIPVMLPLTSDRAELEQLVAELDGFLLTGGQDISPDLYGQTPAPTCGERCLPRDEMEGGLLPLALKRDRPVLGICRGIQFLNAALGGTLYQDLPTEHPSEVEHHQRPPYDVGVHRVELVPGSPLQSLLGKERLMVNSYHHQAIRTLAPALQPMAYSEDRLVEAVWAPARRFVWGVQWHPEFSYRNNSDSRQIFARFVRAAQPEG